MAVKKRYQDELISIIHKHLPNCTIYLFGSRATGKERPGSDIDLAVNIGSSIPYQTLLKILVDIDDTTIPLKIDLVDLSTVDPDFRKNVLKEGIKWTN
ncbi:MAG: polymerase beta domain protein region protein [candidate division TM6 bacterium GW2011_GWF2_37_49]|nr:MAG: polymerase beta domain protein region protein [candidate division TM6 bacterium GW2011_GWF2_37_49]